MGSDVDSYRISLHKQPPVIVIVLPRNSMRPQHLLLILNVSQFSLCCGSNAEKQLSLVTLVDRKTWCPKQSGSAQRAALPGDRASARANVVPWCTDRLAAAHVRAASLGSACLVDARHRQIEEKRCSQSGLGRKANRSLHPFDQCFGDRESQSRPALPTAVRVVRL
jgi:hypothetical protein